METPTITIDMDQKCPSCGEMGAVNNGVCLKCALKVLKHGKRRSIMKTEKVTEYLKYEFTEAEKKDLAGDLAQKVAALQRAEDEKKAIMSDFKSQIDGVQAHINNLATKFNNGYEMRQIECEVIPNIDHKVWETYRCDTGERVKTKAMTQTDLQGDMFEEKGE